MEESKDPPIQQRLVGEIGIAVIKLRRDKETDYQLDFLLAENESGVYVEEVLAGSDTEKEGVLKTGDHLLWVNRTHVEGMNLLGTQQVIQTAPTGTNIVITRWSSCDKKSAEEKMKIGRTIKDCLEEQKQTTADEKEQQLIPNLITTEEPYMFDVTYLA